MATYKEFHINKYLSLRLEREPWADKKTTIHVAGQAFIQCKFLLLNIPITEISTFDEIESIDEAAERVDGIAEREIRKIEIPPEVEFWGHCSNLQVWYEHDYDTRLIHSNLAFPLLSKLAEVGDPLAKKKFKAEVIKRYKNGTDKTREFLRMEGFLESLPLDEYLNLLLDSKNFAALMELSEEVIFDQNPLPTIVSLLECIEVENKKITAINLSDLDLKEFPKAILKLEDLITLSLRNNYLKMIPEDINKLSSLKELWLESNEITHLANSICEMTALEKLWIGGNKIHTLPEKIGNLILLKTLRLGSNEIKELPDSFYKLKLLENLSLSSNRLEYLPDSFCGLTSLKWLSLSNNNLSKLPECLRNLQSLEYLDVSKNPLNKSPESIEKLKKLSIKKNRFRAN